jgi:hypothetical protein
MMVNRDLGSPSQCGGPDRLFNVAFGSNLAARSRSRERPLSALTGRYADDRRMRRIALPVVGRPQTGAAQVGVSGSRPMGPRPPLAGQAHRGAPPIRSVTLNAATGRLRPFSSKFPRSSSFAAPSTAPAMRLLTRI